MISNPISGAGGITLINRRERKLLLMSAYVTPNSQISHYTQHILQSSLNWSETMSLARHWRVRPYLFQLINAHNLQSYVPENHFKTLQEDYQRQAMQTIYLKRQIQDINHLFTKKNISYCLIKGAEMVNTIYENKPVRPMSDIDILCYPKDIDAIVETLTHLGYYQKTMHQSHELQSIATDRKHYPAFFHNKRHTIEVHFNLFPGAANQHCLTETVWEHALPIDNTCQFQLNKDHHLLYLCHHLAYHHQSPREGLTLYWFFDIYQWIKQYQASIDCRLFHALLPEDRSQIEYIYKIVDHQWIKPESVTQNFNITDSRLETILNQNLNDKRISKIKRVLSYYHHVWCDKQPQWSYFERFNYWFRLIFPQFSYVKDRYHIQHKWALPLYCLIHPFLVILRAIKRLVR